MTDVQHMRTKKVTTKNLELGIYPSLNTQNSSRKMLNTCYCKVSISWICQTLCRTFKFIIYSMQHYVIRTMVSPLVLPLWSSDVSFGHCSLSQTNKQHYRACLQTPEPPHVFRGRGKDRQTDGQTQSQHKLSLYFKYMAAIDGFALMGGCMNVTWGLLQTSQPAWRHHWKIFWLLFSPTPTVQRSRTGTVRYASPKIHSRLLYFLTHSV